MTRRDLPHDRSARERPERGLAVPRGGGLSQEGETSKVEAHEAEQGPGEGGGEGAGESALEGSGWKDEEAVETQAEEDEEEDEAEGRDSKAQAERRPGHWADHQGRARRRRLSRNAVRRCRAAVALG